ncbi:MAG: amidase domain-containing protein [Tuberibacillus sp.]
MMEILDQWKNHLQKTGDFWVDRELNRYQLFGESEREAVLRKKDMLKDRNAKIVKTDVKGYVHGVHQYQDQTLVRYRTHISYLINQKGHLYLEEEVKDKCAHFKNDTLISDKVLDVEQAGYDHSFSVIESSANTRAKTKGGYLYDRLAAVKYADRWWNAANPEYMTFEVDCTNYVSQCLYAGGAPMTGRYNQHSGWWYAGKTWSLSWTVAHSLRWYLSSDKNGLQAVEVDRPEKLQPGDVICYDFEGDNRFDHSTFVTAKDAYGMPLVNAHTTNSRHRYWSYEDSSAYTDNIQYKFYHIDAD